MFNVTVSKGIANYDIEANDQDEAIDIANREYNDRDFELTEVDEEDTVLEIPTLAELLSSIKDVANVITENGEYYGVDDEATEMVTNVSELSEKIENYLR